MKKSKKQDLTPSERRGARLFAKSFSNNEVGNACYPHEPFAFSVVL
jgi:hypothetical protein